MDLWDDPSSAVDFGFDELVDMPMKWLERLVDYLPDWPSSWVPDGPPEWLIDLIEKYAPVLEKYLPSSYIHDMIRRGLPHFYVQQNVCEKAFDIGVLVLTLGSLLVAYFLLRRCLAAAEAGARSSQNGFVCEGCRAEKSEVLPEELVHVEKRVECLKSSCQSINKKLLACLQGQGTDGSAIDKRMKKLPEMLLSGCMSESSTTLGDSIFGNILGMCGKVQKLLGNELLEYETEVERKVIGKQSEILENDIPSINKQRKQLAKLTLDMDSARTRYQTASRHSVQAGNNAAKADVIKEEMEDASLKVEHCRDALVGDMFNLISKESEFAQHLVTLVKIQAQYHQKALTILDTYTRHMEEEIGKSSSRPVYGCSLEEHLKVTDRHIALPVEVCICFLAEYCMAEEGLFRVAGSTSKLKKLKAAFDANVWDILDMTDYIKDPHAVAGALKMYLRELPVPLMTFTLYNEWMQAARISDPDTRLKTLWTTIQKLPVPYYNNLKYLMKFLSKMTASVEITKMTAQNLAIVMAPNLIWSPDEGSSALGMNMSLANTYSSIVDTLITNADYFFPGDVEFYLPSPILKSPHDLFGSSSGNLNHSDEIVCPTNGDAYLGVSTIADANAIPTQPSPQMGGSPKSLRRNKKPAPPAPSALREKNLNFDRFTASEKMMPEKFPSEKPVVERKLSSSSDKSLSPSGSVGARINNNHERGGVVFGAFEKPQIPEKPVFEKRSSAMNDLKPTFPVPAERHHVERVQNSVPSVEKQPAAAFEELPSPLAQEERFVPEIVSPTGIPSRAVGYDWEEEESSIVSHRPRSPLNVDTFDHYRPDWYGIEEMRNGHREPQEEPKTSPPTLEAEMLRISREAERLLEQKLRSHAPFKIEAISKDELSSELSDASSMEKEAPESVRREVPGKDESAREPAQELSLGFASKGTDDATAGVGSTRRRASERPDEGASKTTISLDVLGNLFAPKKELIVKTSDAQRLFTKSPERRLTSDEFIVIDMPPHSMQFIKPAAASSEDVAPTKKEEHAPARQQIAFDVLGNLTLVSSVSPIREPTPQKEEATDAVPQQILREEKMPSDADVTAEVSGEKRRAEEIQTSEEARDRRTEAVEAPEEIERELDFDAIDRTRDDRSEVSEEYDDERREKNEEADSRNGSEERFARDVRDSSVDAWKGDASRLTTASSVADEEDVGIKDYDLIQLDEPSAYLKSETSAWRDAASPTRDYLASLYGAEDVTESESPHTVKELDDDYLRRSSEDFSYLASSNYPLRRERPRRSYYGTESRSDSVTDSDDWNRSERSASPVKPRRRLSRNGRQASQESKSSDDYERPDSPFHFRYQKKSPFLMRAERPLSPYSVRAERPLSPTAKSQSVPSTPPPEKSRQFAAGSYDPVRARASSVDAWFAETEQRPVAKPRRPRRRPPVPGGRPKRPARPPNLPTVAKPGRPDKPPPPPAAADAALVPEKTDAGPPARPRFEAEPWASFSELDVELQPLISRGMLLARGSSPSTRGQLSKQSSGGSREGGDAGIATQPPVQGSPAAPKRPPRPQPPPPPPPFKPRSTSSTEDTHL